MDTEGRKWRSLLAAQLAEVLDASERLLDDERQRQPHQDAARQAVELLDVLDVLVSMGWSPPSTLDPLLGSRLTRPEAEARPDSAADMTGGKAPAVEPRPVTVAARGGPPSLARAVEYMHRHAGEPLTVRAVARAARVSSRALQHSFARHLGTSPQAYLHYCRLDGARAELLAAEPGTVTVRQVAANWQFSNAGRFAADYRRQFGEAPSTTLRS